MVKWRIQQRNYQNILELDGGGGAKDPIVYCITSVDACWGGGGEGKVRGFAEIN